MTLTLSVCVALILHMLVWMTSQICADDSYVIVSTSYGRVRGVTVDDGTEPKVNKFMGIPYAMSTAGNLLFTISSKCIVAILNVSYIFNHFDLVN